MKKNILLFSIAVLGLTACSDDYLETAPQNAEATETILGTTETAEMAINGICKAMTTQYLGTQGLNGEGTLISWYANYAGNDAQKSNLTGWSGVINSTYHLTPTSTYDIYPWYYYYKLIANANGVICNIDDAVGADGDKAFLKAQALTFRAYSFFRLSELYARRWSDEQGAGSGIVLRIDQSTGDQPLATLAETYQQIYADLDEAISLFQSSGRDRKSDEFYKPGLDVAYAVYARAALTREDWTNAAKYAQLARQGHNLMSTTQYNDGFSTPNNEWIWGVYEASDQTLYYYSLYAYLASNSSASIMRSYPITISKELIDQIPETDVRRNLFLVPTEEEWAECNVTTGRSTGKLQTRAQAEHCANKGGDGRINDDTYIFAYMHMKFLAEFMPGGGSFNLFRASEMYYTEAEADCHLGQEAQAQQLLYDVTSRFDPSYTKSTKTGAALLDEVRLYRRFDLWGEGRDWFDYKRWGLPLVRKSRAEGGNWHTTFAITLNPNDANNWTWILPLRETDYNEALK